MCAMGVALPDNVTTFPPEIATQAEAEKLDNLGQQISTLVQQYNETKREIVADSREDRKAKFAALLEQRKAAIEACMTAWKAKEAQVAPGQNKQLPALAGLGQVDLSSLETQITTEQSKLTILQNYYTAYKTAVDAGQEPPPVPAELAGTFGMSAGTLALIAAGLAALYFFFAKK